MSIHKHNENQAFAEGDPIWVVPDQNCSSILAKLDWYLNFQLKRAQLHQSATLSPQIVAISAENQLPDFNVKLDNSRPLLIPASFGLPTEWVMQVPLAGDFKAWVQKVEKSCLNMYKSRARVFLPEGKTFENFKSAMSQPQNIEYFIVESDNVRN